MTPYVRQGGDDVGVAEPFSMLDIRLRPGGNDASRDLDEGLGIDCVMVALGAGSFGAQGNQKPCECRQPEQNTHVCMQLQGESRLENPDPPASEVCTPILQPAVLSIHVIN